MASVLALCGGAEAQQALDRDSRLQAVRDEIDRLRGELSGLGARERGLLGEIERLRARLRLEEAQAEEVALRTEEVAEAIAARDAGLAQLEQAQAERLRYLSFRLREIYKQGPQQTLRRAVSGAELERYLDGVRYAGFLSDRDARTLADYRSDRSRLAAEREVLVERRSELARLEQELERSRRAIESTRIERTALLQEVRDDAGRRKSALAELEQAASELDRLAASFLPGAEAPSIDVRKFRGLLDWPAEGKVSAGFGSATHPRFKTRVPHPGLDIDAAAGAPIRAVFDGRVVFAEWMRGYGLTAIVDHGQGVLSIYAHASAMLVEPGEQVLRGQALGMVGETGSLRGPYLYFELREAGGAVDPRGWLRPR